MEKPSSTSKRSKLINKLCTEYESRRDYTRATLTTLIPSQLKALRLREGWTQTMLGEQAGAMKQNRLSMIEKPGAVSFTLETLIRLASAYRLGLQVRFVPFSEMREWENSYSQDAFKPHRIEDDTEFIDPDSKQNSKAQGGNVEVNRGFAKKSFEYDSCSGGNPNGNDARSGGKLEQATA